MFDKPKILCYISNYLNTWKSRIFKVVGVCPGIGNYKHPLISLINQATIVRLCSCLIYEAFLKYRNFKVAENPPLSPFNKKGKRGI